MLRRVRRREAEVTDFKAREVQTWGQIMEVPGLSP